MREIYERSNECNPVKGHDLLLLLFPSKDPVCKAFIRSLLCTLAYIIDESHYWSSASASTDAILDCPVLVANTRARRLEPELKRAIGKEIGARTGGATAGKFHKTMGRFRQWSKARFGVKVCANAHGGRLKSYRLHSRVIMHHTKVKQISIAMDGTRKGHRNYLYCALYAPRVKQAVWLPPQVTRVSSGV